MTSLIDPTKPADLGPADKADLRANLQAAKSEIEALQDAIASGFGTSSSKVGDDRPLTAGDRQALLFGTKPAGDLALTLPDGLLRADAPIQFIHQMAAGQLLTVERSGGAYVFDVPGAPARATKIRLTNDRKSGALLVAADADTVVSAIGGWELVTAAQVLLGTSSSRVADAATDPWGAAAQIQTVAADDSMVLVCTMSNNFGGAPDGVTIGGVPMTLVPNGSWTNGDGGPVGYNTSWYYILAADLPAAGDHGIEVNWPGNRFGCSFARSLKGARQVAPTALGMQAIGTSTGTIAHTVEDGAAIFAGLTLNSSAVSGFGWQQGEIQSFSSAAAAVMSGYIAHKTALAAGSASTGASWSSGGLRTAFSSIVVKPA